MTALPAWLHRLLPESGPWTPVTRGQSGAFVLHNPIAGQYLKAVPAALAHELTGERDRNQWLSGTGIPGPQVIDWLTSDEAVALVTSAVEGISADQLDTSELLTAWPFIADTLRDLHSIPASSCTYTWSLGDMMAAARETVVQDRVQTEFLPQHLQTTSPVTILESLERELPRRQQQEDTDHVVCHGDLCLPNILIDPDTFHVTGLIDLGRLGRADPYSDISLFLANARGTWPDENVALEADRDFAHQYGIRLDPERQDFYLRLDPLTW